MKEIHLGRVLMDNRHKRGITQDELAEYIGVSKPAVSKWETGTTYPDITLLPQLASFFNISIDELMGYEPQMTKEDIRKLHHQLSIDFSSRPFNEVLNHCREIIRKYYSCFPLLYQIGALLVNHSMLAKETGKTVEILEEAKELFVRVKTESEDIELAKQALMMEAVCLLSLGKPDEVLDLLSPVETPLTFPESLLASAYQMTGKTKQALSILQTGIYQQIVGLLNQLTAYLGLCLDDPEGFEEAYQRTLAIAEAFQIKTLHPSILMPFYITAAQGYMSFGNREKALDLLEEYEKLVTGNIYPLRLHGDRFFNLLDDWLENTLALGSDLPRDEKLIRQSMTEAVSNNPAFAAFENEPRFQNLINRLKKNEEG